MYNRKGQFDSFQGHYHFANSDIIPQRTIELCLFIEMHALMGVKEEIGQLRDLCFKEARGNVVK